MMASTQQYWLYLRLWLGVLLTVLFLAAAFNYGIDPYGLFDTDRIEGFNAVKPAAGSHVRRAKPYQVERFAPRAVIAGNSRPELGLNPGNACWPVELRPAYNLGLPGAGVYMQTRVLQHAIVGSSVGLVLWGLDFLDFLGMHAGGTDPRLWPPVRATFEDRLRVNADGSTNPGYAWKKLEDQLHTLFSLDTMKDSLETLFGQGNPHASSIRRDGFNPARDYLDIIAWEGQGVLFRQKNSEVIGTFSRPGMKLFQGDSHWSQEFESVRRLLRFAREHGVQVVLFINPYHADYLVSLELAGHWPHFEAWKRQLTRLADASGVELWDFSGINPLSTEMTPAPGDKKDQLRWFWEPAHYRKEYGDLMLSRLLRRSCDSGNTSSVGVVLTPENIDAHLIRLRSDMTLYQDLHAGSIERLRALRPASRRSRPLWN